MQQTSDKATSSKKNVTIETDSDEFYAKHKKVYPRKVSGIFASLRTLGVFILLPRTVVTLG